MCIIISEAFSYNNMTHVPASVDLIGRLLIIMKGESANLDTPISMNNKTKRDEGKELEIPGHSAYYAN